MMESSSSESRPSSLPSKQGASARKTTFAQWAKHTGGRAAEKMQTLVTPSKLIERKSLGFAWLGLGGGSPHATEEKQAVAGEYAGLTDSDNEEEDYSGQRQRTRQKLSQAQGCYATATSPRIERNPKRLPRRARGGSWGPVLRIYLVGMQNQHALVVDSGVESSSLGPSGGCFFNRNSSGGTPSGKGGPVLLPQCLTPFHSS